MPAVIHIPLYVYGCRLGSLNAGRKFKPSFERTVNLDFGALEPNEGERYAMRKETD